MKISAHITKIINWIAERLNHRQQMYLLSLFIGIISGLAAVLLKSADQFSIPGFSHAWNSSDHSVCQVFC
jgi:uncharacterized membrane protein YagU involved in acid resistance